MESPGHSDEILSKMRAGVRAAVDRVVGVSRMGAYPTLTAVLCAGASAPIAAAALGSGPVGAAALGVLGGVGGGALTNVVTEVIGRLKADRREGIADSDLETALAERFDELLYTGDQLATELRDGVAAVLAETEAVDLAVEAAIREGDEAILIEIKTLADDYVEFRPMLARLGDGVDEALQRLERIESRQEADRELTWRILSRIERQGDLPPEPVHVDLGGQPPYCGLSPFREDQSAMFFGRERLTEELAYRAARSLTSAEILVVTGASGAGKSSLLHAGLLPVLAQSRFPIPGADTWDRIVMTPGSQPVELLETRLAERAESREREGSRRLVLVVDQFEELFTRVQDEAERKSFIAALRSIASGDRSVEGLVVLGLRGDFVGRCADYPELVPALQDNAFVVGPMSSEELRQTLTGPAAATGLELEAGLADDILADLRNGSEHTGYGSAALPLLSQTMLMLWQRREGNRLTRRGYLAFGGVSKSVQASAEEVYSTLDPEAQATARHLFRRMILVAPDGRLTRRPAKDAELAGSGANARSVLERFTTARLVVRGDDASEIAHDALLVHWHRLRGWTEPDRRSMALRSQLIEDAAEWEDSENDPAYLYRGSRLAAVEREERGVWSKDSGRYPDLGETASAFLDASQRHARRRRRTGRVMASSVAALLAIALVASVMAFHANEQANEEQHAAIARRLAAESLALVPTDGSRAQLLAAAAWEISETDEAWTAMTNAADSPAIGLFDGGHGGDTRALAFSADGSTLISGAADGTLAIWDTATWDSEPFAERRSGGVSGLELSPDGSVSAIASFDGVLFWDMVADEQRALHRHEGAHGMLLEFSADGARLVGHDADGIVRVWDAPFVEEPTVIDTGADITGLALSSDGAEIIVGDWEGWIRRWNIESGSEVAAFRYAEYGVSSVAAGPTGTDPLFICATGHCQLRDDVEEAGRSVAGAVDLGTFSPDGRLVAATLDGSSLGVWRASDQELLGILPYPGDDVGAIDFSSDGTTVAAAVDDGVMLWDLSRLPSADVKHGFAYAHEVRYTADGSRLVATGTDSTQVWGAGEHPEAGHPHDPLAVVAIDPHGELLARTRAESDYDVEVIELATGDLVRVIEQDPSVEALDFSPDGSVLAVAKRVSFIEDVPPEELGVELWDMASGEQVAFLRDPGGQGYSHLDFSPDGSMMATVEWDTGVVKVWDLETGAVRHELAGNNFEVHSLSFSPDGSMLTAGTLDGVSIWELATGDHTAIELGRNDVGFLVNGFDLSFSPSGRYIAVATSEPWVAVWDLETETIAAKIPADAAAQSVDFSADGSSLAIGAASVRVVDVGFLQDPYTAVCEQAGRSLTDREWETFLGEFSSDSLVVCG